MKRLLLSLTLVGTLLASTGCGSDATALANVQARFPGSQIAKVPDTAFKWIVRKPDGSIWYAWSSGDSEHVFDIVQIIDKPEAR